MRIVWLSANLLGYQLLREALMTEAEIVAIITLSKKATTRMYDGVDRWQSPFRIPVYKVENINRETRLLESLRPDLLIMCGWRQILNRDILKIPVRGVVAFHPTLLPLGRGSAPIINTILTGQTGSGITMYYAGEGIDNGDIIGQSRFRVNKGDYACDIYSKVIEGGKELIREYLPLLITGNAPRNAQDEAKATYSPQGTLKDNEINLELDSDDTINRKIRAFSAPYLGAFIKLKEKKLIIWHGEVK